MLKLLWAGQSQRESHIWPRPCGNMRLEVCLSVCGETWERAVVWVVSSMRGCQEGFYTTMQHVWRNCIRKVAPWVLYLNLVYFDMHKCIDCLANLQPVTANFLSKRILLSHSFLFPVFLSGIKISCCSSSQQLYLQINTTIACVYTNI